MKRSEISLNESWVYHDPKKNLFLETNAGRAALRRIKVYGATNINYNWMCMYGIQKIQKDLNAALKHKFKTKVYLGLEAFMPDNLMLDLAKQKGVSKFVKYLMPIMPPLIIKIIK